MTTTAPPEPTRAAPPAPDLDAIRAEADRAAVERIAAYEPVLAAARGLVTPDMLDAMREAGARLMGRDRLGRDVFARGGAVTAGAKAERAADLPALLRTYARLMGPPPEQAKGAAYRPRLHPLWRVPDALARMEACCPGCSARPRPPRRAATAAAA